MIPLVRATYLLIKCVVICASYNILVTKNEQVRHCMCNVTLRRITETIVALEKQLLAYIF
jgi:hypothetical protein